MRGCQLINNLTQTFNLNFEIFAVGFKTTHYICRYFSNPLFIYCRSNWCAYYQENFSQRFYYKDTLSKARLKQFIAEQLYYKNERN